MENTKVPEYYRQEKIKFYEAKILELDERIKELDESRNLFIKELAGIKEDKGYRLGEFVELYPDTSDEYNNSWDWTTKIAFVLEKESRVLKAGDVTKKIIELEPDLKNSTDDKDFPRKSIAATLSRKAKKKSTFIKYLVSSGNSELQYYGLKSWLDENRMLKEEYKP